MIGSDGSICEWNSYHYSHDQVYYGTSAKRHFLHISEMSEGLLKMRTNWSVWHYELFFPGLFFFSPVFWKCQCFDKRRNYKVFFSPFSDVPGHLCLNWLYIVDRWMFVTLYLKVEHIWQAAAHILKCHWNSRQLLINFMGNLLFRKSVLII